MTQQHNVEERANTRLGIPLFISLITALYTVSYYVLHSVPSALAVTRSSLPIVSQSTSELASRFRKYRQELSNPASASKTELRQWSGPLHTVMNTLGERIGSGHYTVDQVISLMGYPDKLLSSGASHIGIVVPTGQKHLIYWWRGNHDYLYFVVEKDIILSVNWWFAGE
jgi:hypothetical protein